MALITHPNGTSEQIEPRNGQYFTKEELMELLGGDLNMYVAGKHTTMVCSEHGEDNLIATAALYKLSDEHMLACTRIRGDSILIEDSKLWTRDNVSVYIW